jgi:putative peptidoglycan lipid II flippase
VREFGINMLNTFAMTVIATTLAAGSVTIYQFAYNIQFFPIGIIAVSFAVASFPSFVEYANDHDKPGFIQAFSNTVSQVFFFIIPASIVFLLLRAQIVRVVVGAGAFGWEETIRTADTLAFFTLSLFAQGLIYLFARAFYAYKDTVTPLVAGLVAMVTTIVAALLFSREFGVIGLAMSFSLGSMVNLALLWAMLRQKLGSLGELGILQSLFRVCVAAVGCAVVVQIMKSFVGQFITLDTFFAVLSQGLIAGGAGLLVYGLLAWFLRSPEMIGFVASMRRQFFRAFKPSEPTIAHDHDVV